MKEKIIYGLSFLMAFIVVTLLMIYAASAYRNVFKFDFTPVDKIEIRKNNTINTSLNSNSLSKLKKELIDTLHAIKDNQLYDTLSFRLKDSMIVDSLRFLLSEFKKLKAEKELITTKLSQQQLNFERTSESVKKDSAYKAWLKNTVKIYEAMDSKKAAKIIQSYSDNIARDIIFSMKKKKAAEIITELKPEIANRIISVQ